MSRLLPQRSDLAARLADRNLDANQATWQSRLQAVTASDVERELACPPGRYRWERLLTLISPAAEAYLEEMAQQARVLTVQRFGKTIGLYAPLYLSNDCINQCLYCGFNCDSRAERRRLSFNEAIAEAELIAAQGFTDLLLVSSEDPSFVTIDYLTELTRSLRSRFSTVSIEIHQLSSAAYQRLFEAGIDGVTLYQETYDRATYKRFHRAGPKADYERRLRAFDDAAQAGMRRLGLGTLLGLADWRMETLALAEHGHYLMKHYWRSHISFSFPRLRPANDVQAAQFRHLLTDRHLVQMILSLRLCFADAGLVLSTRECAALRNKLVQLGITRMSAGSKTSPGGYSHQDEGIEQFQVSDTRTADQIAQMLSQQGFDPVWKDWDAAFTA
jgi:2-iminoacetate synthase